MLLRGFSGLSNGTVPRRMDSRVLCRKKAVRHPIAVIHQQARGLVLYAALSRRIINCMSECPPAPWPNRDGYVHHGALFRQAVDLQVNSSGPIVPLSPKDFTAFRDRD